MACLTVERAGGVAARCGVTRLGEITRLDRLGIPVFQAFRPWGRALSVHQGKGLTTEAARLGALMEAVESDHAESFAGERRTAAFNDLAPGERAAACADFAASRDDAPGASEILSWTPARRLIDNSLLWVPFDCVSLDYTREADTRLDRSSNGLGARGDLTGAILTGLLEVIERDAYWRWGEIGDQRRALTEIDTRSVPFDWWRDLLARLDCEELGIGLYCADAIVPTPVIVSELVESINPGERRRAIGVACRPTWEAALVASVTEAAQVRLTIISGARDDLLGPDPTLRRAGEIGVALPLPPDIAPLDWTEVATTSPAAEHTPVEIARRLAKAGYRDTAVVDLSRTGEAACVVKVMAPGLAAFERARRPCA